MSRVAKKKVKGLAIPLYQEISILIQFLAGRKVRLTGDSDNRNVKVLDLKSTVKIKMKKVVILFS